MLGCKPLQQVVAFTELTNPFQIYRALCPKAPPLKPRYAALRKLHRPSESVVERQLLDSGALVLYFPAPHTVTGEDVLELHIHGGPAIVKAVLAAIPEAVPLPIAVRYAEPGEFTRRAFYNNRLDLTEIEALGDALSAETEQQRRLAIKGTNDLLSRRYESWRQQLLYARGELEALIDFSEDQHFDESPVQLVESVGGQVNHLIQQIESNIENASKGELLRNGISVAFLGAPNAGKSSLLNRIVGREAAIVSKEAGTTRDVVELNIDIGGFYCRLEDVAGLREFTESEVEVEGMRRAKERVLNANVVILVLSFEPRRNNGNGYDVNIDDEILSTLLQCNPETQRLLFVINKSDLDPSWDINYVPNLAAVAQRTHPSISHQFLNNQPVFISCCEAKSENTSDPGNIQTFLKALTNTFQTMTSAVDANGNITSWEESLGATIRQRLLLSECRQHLKDFVETVAYETRRPTPSTPRAENGGEHLGDGEPDVDIVIAAENLRAAANCLARITGRGEAGDVEEVLGVVFEKYSSLFYFFSDSIERSR